LVYRADFTQIRFPQGQMILIVDDQKDAGTSLERLLRYAGHESVSVTGGAEALAMLHVRKPALMILDVNMPEMDGLTVLRTIKEHEELKDVRVVMYSSDTHHETMTEAKRLGAVDFLVKGTIGFDKLVARIGHLAAEPHQAG
jgi:two-component system response regulator PrrA